ncbi:hypothetical protein [Pseudotabrizicola sp. L79]
MRIFAVIGLIVLSACGADGPPETPAKAVGVSVSGDAQLGVVVGG